MAKKKKKKKKEPDIPSLLNEFTEKLLVAVFSPNEVDALRHVTELKANQAQNILEAAERQQVVLEMGQLFDNSNKYGRTPLQYAAVRGHHQVAQILVESAAGLDLGCHYGHTPLHLAAVFGQKDVLALLLTSKANPDAADTQKETALHSAAWAGRGEESSQLIAARASVNAVNQNGRTPMHLAVLSGNANVASLLVNAGADVNIQDDDDITPQVMATKMTQPAIAVMIRSHETVRQCQQSIRELQAMSRGPGYVERTVLNKYEPLESPSPLAIKASSDAEVMRVEL